MLPDQITQLPKTLNRELQQNCISRNTAIKLQNEGYAYAVVSIMQQAVSCQPVPLTFGNDTIDMIAVECVNQALQQAQVPA